MTDDLSHSLLLILEHLKEKEDHCRLKQSFFILYSEQLVLIKQSLQVPLL